MCSNNGETPSEHAIECGKAEELESSPLAVEKASQCEERLNGNRTSPMPHQAALMVSKSSDYNSVHEFLGSPPPYTPTLMALCTDSESRRMNPCGTYESGSKGLKQSKLYESEEVKSSGTEDTDERQHTSIFKRAKQLYSDLVSAIIRPPRLLYDPKYELGSSTFVFQKQLFKRTDFEVVRMAVVYSHSSLHCITLKINEGAIHHRLPY